MTNTALSAAHTSCVRSFKANTAHSGPVRQTEAEVQLQYMLSWERNMWMLANRAQCILKNECTDATCVFTFSWLQ